MSDKNNKQDKNLNLSENEKSEFSEDQSSIKKIAEVVGNTYESPPDKRKINRTAVLDKIKEKGEISKYQLAKEMNCNYKTIHYIIRDFEFAGVVSIRVVLNNGRAVNLVSIPKVKEAKE